VAPKVLVVTIPGMIGEPDLAPLSSRAHVEYRELSGVTEGDLARLCDGYDYLMLNYDVVKHLGDSFYDDPSVRQLKAISFDMTGVDWASPHSAARNGIPLLNVPHYSTDSVAESTLCEVLLHSRRRHLAYMDEIRGRDIQERMGVNIRDRLAGVVGLGSIGTRVAELLAGVGMNVAFWNRSPRPGRVLTPLEDLFASADVICICVKTVIDGPERNVGMIGEDLLRRCRNSIIVNLANFKLVDHDAMARSLSAGHVGAYTVERTPEAFGSAVAQFENVHLSNKDAWFSGESLETLRRVWTSNILAAIEGRMENRV